LNFYDTLGGINNGAFSNKVITLNVLQRKANTTAGVFNYNTYFTDSKTNTLNPNPVINNYQNRLKGTMYDTPPPVPAGLEVGCLRMAAGNSGDKQFSGIVSRNAVDEVANDIMIEKYLPNRVGRLALANYTRIKVTIPGDPNITVGKVINFSTYQISPVTYSDGQVRPVDPYYSGKYLVTAVRHIIQNNGYKTVLELCKDSNTVKIAGFNTSDPTLISLVNGVQV
jgi:hypothetical protein